MTTVEFDLHGHYPVDISAGLLDRIVQQAWEMGAEELLLIRGPGRNRGSRPGFVNTNTGFLGLTVRRALKSDDLRRWLYHSTIYRGLPGSTSVRLKPNPAPSRTVFELGRGHDCRDIPAPEMRYGMFDTGGDNRSPCLKRRLS
jgi:hypothetical protein